MDTSKITSNLAQPFAILAGCLVLSYFSHVGWWSLVGFSFVIGAYCSFSYPKLGDFFVLVTGLLLIVAIIFMRWSWF
jgi:hypothetical protein